MNRLNWILTGLALAAPALLLCPASQPAAPSLIVLDVLPAAAAQEAEAKAVDQSIANAQIKDGGTYGSVTGQVVLKGDVPKLAPVVAKGNAGVKDAAVCAADEVPDERLVCDPKSKGIANVFVYLQKAPTVHPDLKKAAAKEVVFDQKGCKFFPHALFARADQTVLVLSDDPIAHNTHTFPVRNTGKNVAIKPNDRTGVPFDQKVAERLPYQVKCDFHAWMTAYWLVLDHPYAAVTDQQGNFTIHGLPAGTHEFTVWQEGAGYVEKKLEVKITGGMQTKLKPVELPAAKLSLK